MKGVLDVGQYVSATIQPRGHPAQILLAWQAAEFDLVASIALFADLRRVLHYPHIRKRHKLSDEEVLLCVDSLALAAVLTPGELEVSAVEADPTDNKVLACAVEGNVDYVVSSDKHLASLGEFGGIPILSPRQFLEILSEQRKQAPS